MLAVGCGSRAVHCANLEGGHMGQSGMVDCKELVAGVSCHCGALHNHKEMIFGPIGVRAGVRDDTDTLFL